MIGNGKANHLSSMIYNTMGKSLMQRDFEKFLKKSKIGNYVRTDSLNGEILYSFVFFNNVFLARYKYGTKYKKLDIRSVGGILGGGLDALKRLLEKEQTKGYMGAHYLVAKWEDVRLLIIKG